MRIGASQPINYFGWIASKTLVAMCLILFFSIDSWAGCSTAQYCNRLIPGYRCATDNVASICQRYAGQACATNAYGYGVIVTGTAANDPCDGHPSASGSMAPCLAVNCTTPRERDSVTCIYTSGKKWENGGCIEIPKEPDPEETCSDQKSACDQIPGAVFTPQQVDNGDGTWSCTGLCDVCGTKYWEDLKSKLARVCCEGGQAPPSFDNPNNYCSASIADDGQVWGTGCSNSSGNCKCQPQETGDMSRCLNQDYEFGDEPGVEPPQDTSSAPIDSLGDGDGDWEYNYYPILDSIRDTLSKSIAPSLRTIATCLATGSCVGGGDTVIVNASGGFDTSLVQNIKTGVEAIPGAFSASIDTLNDSLRTYFRRQDTLLTHSIDSTVKYLQKGTRTLDSTIDALGGKYEGMGDSLGRIAGKLDSMYYGNGRVPDDTGSTIYDGWADGEDGDTTGNGYLLGLGSLAEQAINDTSFDRIFQLDSTSSNDTVKYTLPSVDSLNEVLQESIQEDYKNLEDTLKNYFDTLRGEIQLINFDSAIIAPLGMKVPNTNTCPEQCFAIDLSGAGSVYSGVKGMSWPLCKSYSAMAGLNVLQFIRLILRIITAIGCVYIGMWFIAGKK